MSTPIDATLKAHRAKLAKLTKAWQTADAKRKAAADATDAAKKELIAALEITQGTQRFDLGNGNVLKVTQSETFSVDRDAMTTVKLPDEIGSALIRWKPELNVSVFRALSPEHALACSAFVSSKLSSPSLAVEAVSAD